jgi:hypothetical protein
MRTLYLALILIISSNFSYAKSNNTKKNKNHKLCYGEFIDKYGIDDTSIAIINIFFDNREELGKGQMSFLPISAIVTTVAPPIGISLMAVSSPFFVNGWITCNKYSKKKLVKTLNNYQNKNILSDDVKKKVTHIIQDKEEIYIEDILEDEYNLSN